MKQLFVLLLAASLNLSGQTKNRQPVIRLASAALQPLAYSNRQGQVEGFYKEAISEAARRMGRRTEYSLYQDGLEKTLRANRADVWVAGVANPARRLEFYFSPPWWLDEIYLLVPDASPMKKQEDLADLRLGYGDSPPMAVPIEIAFPKAKWVTMNSVRVRLEALCKGELDAALLSQNHLHLLWQSRPAPCGEAALRLVKQDRVRQELSLVSAIANRDLVDRLYAELAAMMRDGALARLAAEYPMLSTNSSIALQLAPESRKRFPLLEVALAGALLLLVAGAIYLRRLQQQRQQTDAALSIAKSASIAKDQFLATLSHEIRTPLNAVSGYLDLLEETLSRPEQRNLAQEVRQAAQALMSMVSEILDYSQLSYGRAESQSSEFSLPALVEECVAALRQKAEAKGLELVVHIRPDLPALLCSHPRRILQILINLIGNGVKFTESGYVRLNCQFDRQAMRLMLSVEDSGPGIAPDEQALIFEPFLQLNATDERRQGGVGLGLAIVKRIVESLGGSIALQSSTGSGSRFDVVLPATLGSRSRGWLEELKLELDLPQGYQVLGWAPKGEHATLLSTYLDAMGIGLHWPGNREELQRLAGESGNGYSLLLEAEALEEAHSLPRPPAWIVRVRPSSEMGLSVSAKPEANAIASWPVTAMFLRSLFPPRMARRQKQSTLRALVVDDNELNRKLLRALLEKLACEVHVAVDGKQAFEMQIADNYDVIFMDCQMPVMDGLESTKAIRANEKSAPVKIYGVSASTEESTRQSCLTAGMDGYLPKPLGIADLKRILGA